MDALPSFAGQPWWAYAIFLAFAGIGYAVMQRGEKSGRNKPSAENTGEVVALTVDSRAIDRLTGEVSGLAVAITDVGAASKHNTEKLGAIADAIQNFVDDHKRERADRDLDEEVSRRVTDELDRRERAKRNPRGTP